MNNKEVWKDIIGYEGYYQISNFGNVRKLGKKTLLKPKLDKSGYLYVHIRISNLGINKMAKIHRLVAEAFIPNPNKYPIINHKNEIKTDNRVENLRFVTREENINNRLTKKHMSEATKGENNPMYGKRGKDNPNLGKKRTEEFKQARRGESHPNAKEIYCLELDKKFTTIKQASEEFGLDDSAIVKCCKGKQKTCNFQIV